MGVDCSVHLPPDVRVDDVADAIGILLGAKPKRTPLGTKDTGWYVHVPGVSITNSTGRIPCANVTVEDRWFLYHYEAEHGQRLLMPRSRAINIAMCDRLAQFFGGQVDFSDCDNTDIDRDYPCPRQRNDPEDGQEWQDFQQALFNIHPLTPEEIASYEQYAAYKE